jgi:hypothetical protein
VYLLRLHRPGIRGLSLSAALSVVALALVSAGPASATGTASSTPAVKVCGQGTAQVKPASVILACADDGELANNLRWSSWTTKTASATGDVTWRACTTDCSKSDTFDSASAELTLADPATFAGKVLFTHLTLHVTGSTPSGFLRDESFNEAPTPAPPGQTQPPGGKAHAATVLPQAASGTLGYAQIEGFWALAGGPDGDISTADGTYTQDQVAAAITGAESSFLPGNIQQGVDYCGAGSDRAGWGLWQITCGNSVPQYGTNFQLLDPWNNAEAAVYKCDQDAAAGYNCFSPWTTYDTGAYLSFLQTTTADTQLADPGEYVQYAPTPPGTPSSPGAAPGSTYGAPIPTAPTAYVFWRGGPASHYDLYQAQGKATGILSGPFNRKMGPLGSQPGVGASGNGYTYVYWRGTGPQYDLWEAYWNGSKWVGPFNRGMGPLGSAPTVTVTPGGTAFVFWRGGPGSHYALYEAQGPATGKLSGPYDRHMGPLGSAPAAGVNSNGYTYVYWRGTGPQYDLWEAYWSGTRWVGPYNRGMGPLNTAPTVAVTHGGTAYVFWRGGPGSHYALYQAQGPANGKLSGPYDRHMGPLGSAPGAGVAADGYTYVYWMGTGPQYELWEGYWNGSKWVGPFNRKKGPLNTQPTVAIYPN